MWGEVSDFQQINGVTGGVQEQRKMYSALNCVCWRGLRTASVLVYVQRSETGVLSKVSFERSFLRALPQMVM